ncbi:MAG: hypothetical protein ACR2LR_04355, partial [Hassallia sp.]
MNCIVNILAIAWELKVNTATVVKTFRWNVSLNIYIEPIEHLQKRGKDVALLPLYKGFGQRIINLWRCLFIVFGNPFIVFGNPFVVF